MVHMCKIRGVRFPIVLLLDIDDKNHDKDNFLGAGACVKH